jgi:hypothetical protein
MPLESKDGYKPDLLIRSDMAERESASRKASAQYLYQQSETLLGTGRRADARAAYSLLFNLKENYYAYWENTIGLLDSAAIVGIEHVLLTGDYQFSPGHIDSKWQKFYRDPYARDSFDIIIRSMGLQVNVGSEVENKTCYSQSKQIEVGYNEKKDSSGHVIERTPIYDEISATVTEIELSKSANANVWLEVINAQTGIIMLRQPISSMYNFSAKSVNINGDRRALSYCPTESTFCASTPSYWEMEAKVMDQLNSDFVSVIRGRLWTAE